MMQVFVSYATENADVAREVVAALKAGGAGIWIAPDSIPPGAAYNEAIVAGLRASDTLAVLVSKAANASKHVMREVALADDQGKRILPVRIEPVEPSDGLAYYLNLPQWVEWHSHGPAAMAPVIAMLGGAQAPARPRPPVAPPRAAPLPVHKAPSVGAGTATIHIHRAQSLGAGLRRIALLVDGEKVGEIGSGETITLPVAPGRRELMARIDYIKSEPFAVVAATGETPVVQIAVSNSTDVGGQLAGLLGKSSYFKWTRIS